MGGGDGMDLVATIRNEVEKLEGVPPSLQNALDGVFSRAEGQAGRPRWCLTTRLICIFEGLPFGLRGGSAQYLHHKLHRC